MSSNFELSEVYDGVSSKTAAVMTKVEELLENDLKTQKEVSNELGDQIRAMAQRLTEMAEELATVSGVANTMMPDSVTSARISATTAQLSSRVSKLCSALEAVVGRIQRSSLTGLPSKDICEAVTGTAEKMAAALARLGDLSSQLADDLMKMALKSAKYGTTFGSSFSMTSSRLSDMSLRMAKDLGEMTNLSIEAVSMATLMKE